MCLQLNKHLTDVKRLAEYLVKILSSKLMSAPRVSVIIAYFGQKVNDFMRVESLQ